MAARLHSLTARTLAAFLFAACLSIGVPALAQNSQAPTTSAPATTSAGNGTTASHQPPGTTVGETNSARGQADSTSCGDGFWLVIAFIVIVLIAVFFYRRTSERPRQ